MTEGKDIKEMDRIGELSQEAKDEAERVTRSTRLFLISIAISPYRKIFKFRFSELFQITTAPVIPTDPERSRGGAEGSPD